VLEQLFIDHKFSSSLKVPAAPEYLELHTFITHQSGSFLS